MCRFKIAAVQLNVDQKIGDIIADIYKYLKRAKSKGVKIVCFPEDSIYAGPAKNDRIINKVKIFCRELKIWCIIVAHIREKKYAYNQAMLIGEDGYVQGKHKKVHICDYNVMPGSTFDIYDTPFCKIGIAICWDVSSPPALFEMAKKGAKVVFCPLYWCYEKWGHKKYHKEYEKKILESLILARSFDNLMYTVFCNAYDPKEKSLVPYSAIAEPHKIMKEIFDKEGMIVATVNLKKLERYRKKYKKYYAKKISSK